MSAINQQIGSLSLVVSTGQSSLTTASILVDTLPERDENRNKLAQLTEQKLLWSRKAE
jgi:hypothetical protein